MSYISELNAFNNDFAKEHDSFMDLLAVSLSEGRLFMLFHNCSQMSLQKQIQSKFLGLFIDPYMLADKDRLFIIKQIVLSLLYLHLYFEDPIIHGQLDPTNIFVVI